MQTVHLSAHNSLAADKTKIALDSHADTCVVGDHSLIVHDHLRSVNVFGCDPEAGSKCTFPVKAAVAYMKNLRQVVLLLF